MKGVGDWGSIGQINSSEQRTSIKMLGIFLLRLAFGFLL